MKHIRTHILLLVSLLVLSWPAMAYIDPGSGSAIMSAIIGFFVAIGLAVKTYWYKLKAFFTGSKSKSTDQDAIHHATESDANSAHKTPENPDPLSTDKPQ